MGENPGPELPDFEELDLETGNHLVVVVYNSEDDTVEVENPHDLPYHEVLGLLHVALGQWEECGWAVEVEWEEGESGE